MFDLRELQFSPSRFPFPLYFPFSLFFFRHLEHQRFVRNFLEGDSKEKGGREDIFLRLFKLLNCLLGCANANEEKREDEIG